MPAGGDAELQQLQICHLLQLILLTGAWHECLQGTLAGGDLENMQKALAEQDEPEKAAGVAGMRPLQVLQITASIRSPPGGAHTKPL